MCVCCIRSHLVALTPVLRVYSTGTGIRNNLLLSDPFFPSMSLFLPNNFNPPVSLLPRAARDLSVISSFFHPFLRPRGPRVTFYLWHIMHVLLWWWQCTDRLATTCVCVDAGERGRNRGTGVQKVRPLLLRHARVAQNIRHIIIMQIVNNG